MNENTTNNINNLELTEAQLDMLKEMGNIGSGHAITALSELLNKNVEVSLTSVDIYTFWKVPDVFDNRNIEVVGIYSEIPVNSNLAIIQIFPKESILNLINLLNNSNRKSLKDINTISDLDEFSYSIISEIGNILSGNYASALADLLSIKLIPKVPRIAIDTLNAILNSVIAKYSQLIDYILLINTKLIVSDLKLNGTICLIPNINILRSLFEILNIKYDLNL
ncbi:MAG: chemotaxis protein CheC [Promethearchaeota archaeon]|nr:MAG: chemotaxis protein CheC [Candidatus Lokiarchaeota archaeon]